MKSSIVSANTFVRGAGMSGETLEIRECHEADVRSVWQLAYQGDLEWMKWNGPYFHDPVYTWAEFSKEIIPRLLGNPMRQLIVFDGQIVGIISAYWEDGDLKQWLEFGLCLYSSKHWGKQIGTWVCRKWITYLFDQFPEIPHVGFTTWSGNERMMKVGGKLGMKEEARIRKVRYYDGQYFDSVKYGVLREEWRGIDGISDSGSGR